MGGCLLFFEPFKKCVSGDLLPVAFFLFCSGPLAPIVKLLIGDPSSLDPREPLLVLLTVSLEYRVIRLPLRPLLESACLAAALLPFGNRPLAILRTDSSGLRKPAAAVLAAPHGDVALYAAPQRVIDHVPDAGGIQRRRAPPRLRWLEAERDGTEAEQCRIVGAS